MIWRWIIFILIFLFIPFGIAGLRLSLLKHTHVVLTPEQEKHANLQLGKFIFFYWLCDFFYMSYFNKFLVLQFIFGISIMIIVFVNLINSFISASAKNWVIKFGLIQDFIVGIFLSIYLIYIIPKAEIKEIVIPIISSIYGGLLTLVGVAWTIRWTKKESSIEHKNIIRPFIYPCFEKIKDKTICNKYFGEYGEKYELILGYIKNSDKVEFIIRSIIINGIEYPCVFGQGVSKNEIMIFRIKSKDTIMESDFAILRTEDEDGNENIFKLTISNKEDVSIKIVNIEFMNNQEL